MKARAVAKAPGLRQSMAGLHTWTGLLLGWVLYAMFLTGTAAYFKDELSQWMRPELPRQVAVPDAGEVAQRMAEAFGGVSQWSVRLPDERNPVAYAFWRSAEEGRRRFQDGYFDPASGQAVRARDTQGGDFFYRFHFHISFFVQPHF